MAGLLNASLMAGNIISEIAKIILSKFIKKISKQQLNKLLNKYKLLGKIKNNPILEKEIEQLP